MTVPNLHKIESDLKNLGRNFDEMRSETRSYRESQMKILTELARHTERLAKICELNEMRDASVSALSARIRDAENEVSALRTRLWRVVCVVAFLSASGGVGVAQLLAVSV